jgi:hypothetical protein
LTEAKHIGEEVIHLICRGIPVSRLKKNNRVTIGAFSEISELESAFAKLNERLGGEDMKRQRIEKENGNKTEASQSKI